MSPNDLCKTDEAENLT